MKILISIILSSFLFSASSYNMELKSITMFENSQFNYGISDVWGYTDELGNEYAIVGYKNGTKILDVSTNPANPIEIIDIPGPSDNDYYYHRDYKTFGDVLYTVCEMTGGDMGMQVIDLSPLPENIPVQYPTYNQISTSHNLWIDPSGYAFIEHGYNDAIHIVDLSNPLYPVMAGSFGDLASNTHDIFTKNNIAYVSNGWSEEYIIFDISDFNNIQPLATISEGITGYAHNAWLSHDENHLITTEETVGRTVKIWNIEDYENITLAGEYLAENNLAHNVHVMGDLVYISHYTTGVRIIDIYDPTYPVEIAGFDTYPVDDSEGYYGCWGAFPFTQNGYVYASDMQNGLYILDFETKLAGWNSTIILDNLGAPIDNNAIIISQLDGREFTLENNGQSLIGMPEGEQAFNVALGELDLGEFSLHFEAHQTLSDTIYLLDSILSGDVSNDGIINVVDILLMINVILGQSTFDISQTIAGDLNQDDAINILDVIMIVNIILGNN
jgi:choice-of-anchor B domain-containing protein